MHIFVQPSKCTYSEISTNVYNFFFKETHETMKTYIADSNPTKKHGIHHYSLEDFGLTQEDLERDFADYSQLMSEHFGAENPI